MPRPQRKLWTCIERGTLTYEPRPTAIKRTPTEAAGRRSAESPLLLTTMEERDLSCREDELVADLLHAMDAEEGFIRQATHYVRTAKEQDPKQSQDPWAGSDSCAAFMDLHRAYDGPARQDVLQVLA